MTDTIPVFMPTRVERFERLVEGSSTSPAVVMTDVGRAYVKVLDNAEGPHALARDLVGTRLAAWFGLPTFDTAVFEHDGIVDIELPDGGVAEAGPVFATRAEAGQPWGGSIGELDQLTNPSDLTRLVVFDTWTRNHDRHFSPADDSTPRDNKDNVFLSSEGEDDPLTYRLLAIDHTHAFTRGADLNPTMNGINAVQDEEVYGLFPEFRKYLSGRVLTGAIQRLNEVTPEVVEPLVEEVPAAWEVPDNARQAWVDLVCRRASFVADRITMLLDGSLPEKDLFGNSGSEVHDA